MHFTTKAVKQLTETCYRIFNATDRVQKKKCNASQHSIVMVNSLASSAAKSELKDVVARLQSYAETRYID